MKHGLTGKKSNQFKHGLARTKIYAVWYAMIQRCENEKNKSFDNYGGRGIRVDENWLDFLNFYRDMNDLYSNHLEKHGEKNTTLERINNDLGYSKRNCKWATRKEQIKNRRRSVYKRYLATSPQGEIFTFDNQEIFAKSHDLNKGDISRYLTGKIKFYKGWHFEYLEEKE